jgi:hypothetical protein
MPQQCRGNQGSEQQQAGSAGIGIEQVCNTKRHRQNQA